MITTVDLFVLRIGDNEPRVQPVPVRAGTEAYIAAMSRWTRFAGSPAGAVDHIHANSALSSREGLSSLWIAPGGQVIVISPHNHGLTAFYALEANCPPDFEPSGKGLKRSHITFIDFAGASGFMRAQYYSRAAGGVGCSILLERLPTVVQVRTIMEPYETTPKVAFSCELYDSEGDVLEKFADSRRMYDYI